jgi:transposase
MDKNWCSCSILRKLNLTDIEQTLNQAYHKEGAGRPPRKPLGIFKALMVKQIKNIPSDRELYRRLWHDQDLREVCDIEESQKPYHPSQLTRFRERVGTARLQQIMNRLVKELIRSNVISGKKVVFDATFVKAYSRRDVHDDSRGSSDPDARVGRNGKTFDLGYKLHVAVDVKSELPLAVVVAPASDNEKKHAPLLFRMTWKATGKTIILLVADPQYSCKKLRIQAFMSGVRAVIPYPANQMRGQRGVLRVDRCFRVHGPVDEKRIYRLRSSIERTNSRLKIQLTLENHKVRRLWRVTVHAFLCLIAMLLNAVAAARLNRREKVRSLSLLAE